MPCKCNGASTQPCRYCQQETWCDNCGGTEETCVCDYCDACGNTADHDLEGHLFDAGSVYCHDKWGCTVEVEHYHTNTLNTNIEGK